MLRFAWKGQVLGGMSKAVHDAPLHTARQFLEREDNPREKSARDLRKVILPSPDSRFSHQLPLRM